MMQMISLWTLKFEKRSIFYIEVQNFMAMNQQIQNLYLKMHNSGCDKPCIELKLIKVLSFLNLPMFLSIATQNKVHVSIL